jgi:hypothetical protein
MTALALTIALLLGAAPTPAETQPEHPVPAWVPRGAAIGLFIRGPALVPHLRLQWDVTLYEAGRDAIVAMGQLGTGLAVVLPPGMSGFYEHVALLGFGYRNTAGWFHWGFQIGLGPVWYQASFPPGSVNLYENRVLGYAEGRLQAGVHLRRNLIIGIYVGYASPWKFSNDQFPGNGYVGGFDVGFFADWR